ncbi:regulator of G-protein signaling 14a isoform X2 [Colossoma macropomum]|uniref:regulator of G-protein signaling 14a isoform X2 n=1 Tax=Colossoma macropomum TaxID=42526 RepID=UPI001864EBD8|nr:regulator of G-protein signaling 14a isoform X2 [Colossoma macropomum]
MSSKMKTLAVPACQLTQAVSDGELNMSRLSGTGSSPSLNGGTSGNAGPPGADGPASRVVSWAVCFERLLEDPVGVRYFTAFLKSEVSAENILFWQACEKFRKIPPTNLDELKKEARTIYDLYLSDTSFHAVNIDDTARTEESDLEKPTPDMFSKAQQQIFKLMKFDSYARFVRSPLYQNCMLASVEGRPLPDLQPQSKGSRECVMPAGDRKSMEVKMPLSDSKAGKKKKIEKRGSWGADVSYRRVTVSRQESQISVKSSSSVELGSLSGRSENGCSSPVGLDADSGSGPMRADKYCCVYLPDGTASLAPARPGLPLRDMLSGLCEKRGFPLKDVIIYLHGKDKPLSLDQDSSVLRDQQVHLELRVTFTLEIVFAGKASVIVAKSSKTLGEALSSVLQKHSLRLQDVVVTVSGTKEPLNMNTSVFSLANKTLSLANKTLSLDRAKSAGEVKGASVVETGRTSLRPKRMHDMDGLVEMLNRAQCSRADDQRGLLTKEQLELPQFLQLPGEQKDEQRPEEGPESPSNHTHSAGSSEERGKQKINGVNKDPSKEKTVKDCERDRIGSNNGTSL